ncbi:MAG: hypothetical protein JW820_13620 [Spirochaetales bacterium]|nr:hypothetical protein [Spirochaetales bacterium]
MASLVPFSPLWFRTRRVFRSKAYFETKAQEAIDRELNSTAKVSVEVVQNGAFRRPELHLFGQVENPAVIKRAAAIARQVAQGTVEIVIDILVLIDRPSEN